MRKTMILLVAILIMTEQPVYSQPDTPVISAERAVLMGPGGQILYGKMEHERCLIASTTKLMTALVVLEHALPEECVEIPAECCGIEGSSMYLQAGESYTIQELLEGLLLASGNDAAEALAVYCAGDADAFAGWMNEKAEELGMTDSHFVNPHGLDADGQYSSAADLAKLMGTVLNQNDLISIIGKRFTSCRGQSYVNHNKLLWSCPGCLGGKTGYTQAAGRCLVSCCEREGTRLICVTLSAPDDWNDQKALYDWGFQHYETRNVTAGLRYSLPVYGGERGEAELEAEALELFLPRDAEPEFRAELPRFVLAPVQEGERAGTVTALLDGQELGSAALRFTREILPEEKNKGKDP